MRYTDFRDAEQAAMTFMVQQATIIETQVYRIRYPDIQYQSLMPVDTSGPEWAQSITFFSVDQAGRAEWFNHMASDVPLADISRDKFDQTVDMAAIGYRYTIQELGVAMLIPGQNLQADRAIAARRAYDEFMDNVALRGDTQKGWYGLMNNPLVTRIDAAATGTGSTRTFSTKTALNIAKDFNDALTSVYTESLTIEVADTVLIPLTHFTFLSTTPMSVDFPNTTLLQWIKQNNAYTALTGQPLTIRAVRGLETAGSGGTARMILYRNSPDVLKIHLPMPHRFLEVWRTGPLVYSVPGIFRTGGTEVRRPPAMRYVDGI